jgi:hypothetical protein
MSRLRSLIGDMLLLAAALSVSLCIAASFSTPLANKAGHDIDLAATETRVERLQPAPLILTGASHEPVPEVTGLTGIASRNDSLRSSFAAASPASAFLRDLCALYRRPPPRS